MSQSEEGLSREFHGTMIYPVDQNVRKALIRLEGVEKPFWIPVTIQREIKHLKAGDHVAIKANPGRFYWFATRVTLEEPKPPQEQRPAVNAAVVAGSEKAAVLGSRVAPEAAAQPTPKGVFAEIPLDRIIGGLGGFVPRSVDLAETGIDSLAGTMKKPGILQPIVVRRHRKEGYYELVCGERRVRAAERIGLSQLPAVVKDLSDREAFEAVFIENKHRLDLKDVEAGGMLKEMLNRFPQDYPTQEVLGKAIGLSQSDIARYISAYDMAEELRRSPEIISAEIKPEELVERQLRILHQAKPEARAEILSKLKEESGRIPTSEDIKQAIEKSPELRREEKRGRKPVEKTDTGVVWTCGICKKSFTHVHHADGKHSLQEIITA